MPREMPNNEIRGFIRMSLDPSGRQLSILTALEEEGSCTILELAEKFEVSDETVRRDVKHLEVMGYVQKIHGGVRLPENLFETPFRQRQHEEADAKKRIGEATADLIKDGMTVAIESSTTALWVARSMVHQRNVSVITNGLEIVRSVSGRNNNRVYLAGGEVSDITMSSLGADSIDFVKRFTPDMVIIGASALHPEHGVCDFHLQEADFARALASTGTRLVLIADSSKFMKRGLVKVCDFDRIETLVTDTTPMKDLGTALQNVNIITA